MRIDIAYVEAANRVITPIAVTKPTLVRGSFDACAKTASRMAVGSRHEVRNNTRGVASQQNRPQG